MAGSLHLKDFDDIEELEELYPIRNVPSQERRRIQEKRSGKKKQVRKDNSLPVNDLAEDPLNFEFTYNASHHERDWIIQSLQDFIDQQWLDDILRLVKGGKEANVYQCRANPSVKGVTAPLLAAKVYRPRRFRNLKNDHLYREGRTDLDGDGNQITDDGMLHAISKRTEFGRELSHTSWIEHEVKTMSLLHDAGGDVPKVFASENNAILMTFIGDEDFAAPVLHSVRLDKRLAQRLFDRVIFNLELMLSQNRIHGDFSAFNILYWEGEIVIIDFPQAIDPRINRNAYMIFERDVSRICDYFARQGVESEPRRLAVDLWKSFNLKVIPDVHPKLLDSEKEVDRSYWENWSRGKI
jgi:RIO kinase 1